ncbi:MAG: bifunctional oligoribonuclease/PAP phosphatase NrnA [Rickettsiales bacterium]|jgi:phosphoesterase RecJ-like protein|nr:bifunctional oligoribonuclease/PAP phosphatase NrnA [Rickettsiales bacterium]
MNKFAKDFLRKIKDARHILIMGHKNPDGDSLGAVLGLMRIISENFGIAADCSYEGTIPDFLDWIPGRNDMIYAEKIDFSGKYDLVIALDTPKIDMLGEFSEDLARQIGDIIKIDHHQGNQEFADLELVDTSRGSVSEIIYEIAISLGWNVDSVAATCLYAGVVSDNGNFKYARSGDALRVAGGLIDLGADPRDIALNLEIQTKKDILTEALAVANAEFFYGDRLAVAVITREMYKDLNGKAALAMMLLSKIESVEFVAVIKEYQAGRSRVSFRSKTVSVRPVAESFGGGGHDFAAAASFESGAAEAKKLIVKAFSN